MRGRVLVTALGFATIAFAFTIVHARMAPSGGPAFRDFESYYAGGATWRYGGDPYSREVWRTERTLPGVIATRDEVLPFVGPPFGLPFWAVLARLPWGIASLLWGGVLVTSLAILASTAVLLAGVPFEPSRNFGERLFAVLVFAAAFGPLTSGIALGQVAIVAAAGIALAPFAARGRRTIAKTFVVALVAGLQPNLAIALVARIANARTALALASAAVVAAVGSQIALARQGGLAHYAAILAEHAAAERSIAIQTTVGAIARGFGASAVVAATLAGAVAVVALALLAWQCASRRYAPTDRLFLASAAVPLVWPFAHEHDYALLFVPALVVVARARGVTWYLAATAAVVVGVDWLGLAQRPSGAGFEALRAIGAALALATFAPNSAFRLRSLALAAIGLVVFASGALAAAHPLHVWPDGLPLDFAVPRAFDIAQTWGAEQVRAGVARFDVTNAALRACSLAGCAGVWFAAALALRSPRDAVTARATPATS